MNLYKITGAFWRPVWRMRRGMTLGGQAVVFDADERILLVRHGYRPGWHFPGGGVEWNESVRTGMRRELFEETGIKALGEPQLHGVFTNFEVFPGDHVAVFLVREWEQKVVPEANIEIAEQRFFAVDELPEELVAGARNRINELFNDAPLSETWR